MSGLAVQAGMLKSPAIGGEIAWWCPTLDPVGSGNVLTDLIGTNHGALEGLASWVADAGAGGGAAIATPDGVNNLVSFPAGLGPRLTSDFAYSIWFRRDTIAVPAGIVGAYRQASPYPGFFAGFRTHPIGEANAIKIAFRASTSWYWSSETATLVTDSEWRHLYVSYAGDGSEPRVYLDGAPETLNPWQMSDPELALSGLPEPNHPLKAGYAAMFADGNSLQGRFDDLRLFDSSDPAERAAMLWDNGQGRGN